jgi:hypothetical protein
MDDLFRSAAENYRLKDPGDDWDKVLPFLVPPVVTPGARGKTVRYLLLMLTVLVLSTTAVFVSNYVKNNKDSDQIKNQQVQQQSRDLEPTDTNTRKASSKDTNQLTILKNGRRGNMDTTPSATHLRTASLLTRTAGFKSKSKSTVKIRPGNYDPYTRIGTLNESVSGNITKEESPKADPVDTVLNKNTVAEIQKTRDTAIFSDTSLVRKNQPEITTLESTKTDSATRSVTTTTANRNSGWYFGILIGPEWNQIRGQGYNKTGFDAGVSAGYRINSKISIETAFMLAKKYYYTSGQHFNLQMPGKEVVSLQGSTTIIEVPLNVKYDWLRRSRSSFFSSAGLISYFLTNEKNDYVLLVNGAEMNMTTSYTDASRYVAAAVNLAAGYEVHHKKLAIRLQPYIQVPMKGIGVGTMRVMSTGLHFGVFYNK